ncbi:MAG: ATP-binding protein [Nitratireductor sp.]|nr:ATP-binding protein [Nitratireductor sp.]
MIDLQSGPTDQMKPVETSGNAVVGSDDAEDQNYDPNRRRTQGYVIHCDAHHAIISAEVDERVDYMENYWAVGQMVSIWVGENRVIGQTAKVFSPEDGWVEGERNHIAVHVELIGEVVSTGDGMRFTTGISGFPKMGCVAHRIRSSDLAAVFRNNSETTIRIGHVTQDPSIEAKIDFEKLLSRHFAVVGSTGVGKSTSVTLMLRKIVEARPDIRVLLLDPHNEFGSAFPRNGYVLNANHLVLPFWLFTLEEIAEVIFRGQDGMEVEKEILRDMIVAAKIQHMDEAQASQASLVRSTNTAKQRVNADTPIPYRMLDLLKLIDGRIGKLDGKAEKPHLKSLKDRIETIVNDARFQFMFDPTKCGGDRINDVISAIFRIPQGDRPICIMEMSGLPSEVVSSVVSVLCRLAFDLALSSGGGVQTLVVAEEAHRYIPSDQNAGFWPTRMAIGRIAKEGRKYGAYLGIITQRPSELDQTILSQCNTFFAMRLSNTKDQDIIAGAFNSGAQSTIAFLPSISNRECIAFGEAVYSPMRMTFETVGAEDLPGAHIRENQNAVRAGREINLTAIISHMRGTNMPATLSHGDDPYGHELPQVAAPPMSEPAGNSGQETGRMVSESSKIDALEALANKSIEQRYRDAAKPEPTAPRPVTRESGNSLIKRLRG